MHFIIIIVIIKALCIIRVSVFTHTNDLYGFVFTMSSFYYYIKNIFVKRNRSINTTDAIRGYVRQSLKRWIRKVRSTRI